MGAKAAPALTVAILLVLPVASGLPTGTQDDASSGGDASDRCQVEMSPAPNIQLATPIDEGNHNGTLIGQKWDPKDCFVFQPDRPGLLHVRAWANSTSEALCVIARQPAPFPHGTGTCLLPFPTKFLVGPDRPVFVSMSIAAEAVQDWSAFQRLPYTLQVTLEPHDHHRWIQAQANETLTWTGRMASDGFAGMSIDVRSRNHPIESEPYGFFSHFRRELPDRTGRFSWFLSDTSIMGSSPVWIEDIGPLDVTTSNPTPRLAREGGFFWTGMTEIGTGPFNMTANAASTHGVELGGIVVWDGSNRTAIETAFTRRGEVVFATVSDFDDGTGAGIGPVVVADDRRLTIDVDHATRLVFADARTYQTVQDTTRMRIGLPDGSVTELDDAARFWAPDPLLPDALAGPWEATLDHVDGVQMSPIRFAAAEFPRTA